MSTSTFNTLTRREITMTRTFDAPRDLVFEVSTNPVHVRKWWCCNESEMTVCDIDLRVGGGYVYVMRTPDGTEHRFKGTYREIVRPERIVHTETYDMEPWQDKEALVTVLFEEHDGKTTLSTLMVFSSAEECEAAAGTGMEAGMALAYERLGDVLKSLS